MPTLEEWDIFEAEWLKNRDRIPEIVSQSEQYAQLWEHVPMACREVIRQREFDKDRKHHLFLIQGLIGRGAKDTIKLLRSIEGLPEIQQDQYYARDGLTVISVRADDSHRFVSLTKNLRPSSG
jgi:hypothetical protein